MRRTAHTRTRLANVLVIGTGAAGLRAAIAAHEAGCQVVIVGKRPRDDAHTVLAAGGINAALGTVDPEDSWQLHFADTVKEGYFLGDPATAEMMAREAPAAVLELADWGCDFARLPNGDLDQRFFGAHAYRRTCYAGDYTGRAIIQTLMRRVTELDIPIAQNTYVTDLLVHDGTCFGAYAFDLQSGDRTVFVADGVVLAAGGHTRLWRRSSSRRDENTGDGMALALRAGCRLADMELVQFHPTGMVVPEQMAGTLVTEAVRGEGGRLVNADGERYMRRYDPERLELSTRDRVALANYTEIAEGRGTASGGVLLDISHRDKDFILQRLPRMYRQFLDALLLDISRSPMEVAPTAHYSMGGVIVEPEHHATDVDGLYAAGEVTTGLHGANRLGGNSLVETLIAGRHAGEAAGARSARLDVQLRHRRTIDEAAERVDAMIRPGDEFARPTQRALRDTMWELCGVVRSGNKLERALAEITAIRSTAAQLDVRPSSEGYADLAHAFDLQASLVCAEATVQGALARRETRGCHARSDYAELDPELRVNFVVQMADDGSLSLSSRPVAPVPDELAAWIDDQQLESTGRLLE
ncbi:MAG TPA: FAD-binding protein [Euzebyales bacterium]|nr:FAD-binding protein [Euzebyales bacterium]